MSEPEITDEMPAPTQATGPTAHLSDPEYWRGLYCDAIEVGREMLAKERAAHSALLAENKALKEEVARWKEGCEKEHAHWHAAVEDRLNFQEAVQALKEENEKLRQEMRMYDHLLSAAPTQGENE